MYFLDFGGAMVPKKKPFFIKSMSYLKRFFIFFFFRCSLKIFESILIRPNYKVTPFPLMDLVPCFIGLWSSYNNALILLSWAFIRIYLEIVEGSFCVSCTLDMRLDIIEKRLVLTFSKKEVGPSAPQNGLQSTILPLPIYVQTLSPKSKRRRCKVGLSSISAVEVSDWGI